jgi:hypothetical protein
MIPDNGKSPYNNLFDSTRGEMWTSICEGTVIGGDGMW